MNNASINFKGLALSWIFIQLIFVTMVIGGGLALSLDLQVLDQPSAFAAVLASVFGLAFWLLCMYVGYFFKRNNIVAKKLYERTDIGIVRSLHKFSYYLLVAFPLNAVLFLMEAGDLLLIQINAILALPFCLWSLVLAATFYVKDRNNTYDIVVHSTKVDPAPQAVLKHGSGFVKNQLILLLLLALAVVGGIALLVVFGDKAAPLVAVLIATALVLAIRNNLKKNF